MVDTREQQPFKFPCSTVVKKLESGDYSIEGLESEVSLERKKVGELYTCFGADRERFEREFVRLASFRFAAVIVEGSWNDILRQPARAQLPPQVVRRSLISWAIKYGVHLIPAGSRDMAEGLAFDVLELFYRQSSTNTKRASAQFTLEMLKRFV